MNTNLTLPIRQALIGLGPLLAAFGVVDEAQWGALAGHLSTMLGILAAVIGVAWQWWVSRPSAKIEQVAALPNVKRVITDEATAQATPTPNITAR